MTPEKLFHELLGLGLDWEVVASRFERATGLVCLAIRETDRRGSRHAARRTAAGSLATTPPKR